MFFCIYFRPSKRSLADFTIVAVIPYRNEQISDLPTGRLTGFSDQISKWEKLLNSVSSVKHVT